MGGKPSKREVAIFETSKADEDLQRMMETLQVEDKELKALIKIFCKIDKSADDQINQHEMFKYFKLEYDEFTGRVFKSMDADRAGSEAELSFVEFFLAMFNFLTSTLDTLVVAAFKLYDTDGGGDIGVHEIQSLCRMVYGDKDVAKNTETLLKKLDRSGDQRIGLAEFQRAEEKAPLLFDTMLKLQDKFRTKILGVAYWKGKTKVRHAILEPKQTLFELYYRDGRHARGGQGPIAYAAGSGGQVGQKRFLLNKEHDDPADPSSSVWKEAYDENKKRSYWYNTKTKETTWVKPNS